MGRTPAEQQKDKKILNEDRLKNFCDNIKHNVCIIRSPKRTGQKTYLKK